MGLRNLFLSFSYVTSPSYTPKHNGYFERCHCHIVETGLSLLSHASIPLSYWSYAFTIAAYLINRLPTPTLNIFSLYNKILSTPSNYYKLHSYGCHCYPWLWPYSSHKLALILCVFIGYSSTQSVYLCLEPTLSRIYTTHHVKFVESIFSFILLQSHLERPSSKTYFYWCFFVSFLLVIDPPHTTLTQSPLWIQFKTYLLLLPSLPLPLNHLCHLPYLLPLIPKLLWLDPKITFISQSLN